MKRHFYLIICGILASNIGAGIKPRNEVQFYAGNFNFDLQGNGNDTHIGISYQNSVNEILSLKASGTYIRTHQQIQQTIPLFIPEIGAEIGKKIGIVKFFGGAGTGVGVDSRKKIPKSITYAKMVNSGSGIDAVLETVEMNDVKRFTPTEYLEIGLTLKPLNDLTIFTCALKLRGHEYYPTGSSTELSFGIGTQF